MRPNETEIEPSPAVRVRLVADETRGIPRPDHKRAITTAFGFESLDSTNPYRQLLPESTKRLGAYLQAITAETPSTEADGFTTAPAKNTPWVFLTLPPGTYDVEWNIWLGGTLSAANDADNMALITSNNTNNFVAQGVSPGVAGYYPQQPLKGITILAGQTVGHYLAVQAAPNNATAASIYGAQIIATPVSADVYLCRDETDARQISQGSKLLQATLLPHGNTAPWPVRGQNAVWIATLAAGVAGVSWSADYEG